MYRTSDALRSRVWPRTSEHCPTEQADADAVHGRFDELALQVLAQPDRFPRDNNEKSDLCLPYANRYLRQRRSLFPMWSDELWSEARAFVETNAIGLNDPDIFLHGPPIYTLNHSCWPNAILSFRDHSPSNAVSGDGIWELIAIEPIKRGEQITLSYVSLAMPTAVRQWYIRAAWGFDCKCRRCTAHTPYVADFLLSGITTTTIVGDDAATATRPQKPTAMSDDDTDALSAMRAAKPKLSKPDVTASTAVSTHDQTFDVLIQMAQSPTPAWLSKAEAFSDEYKLPRTHWQVHELREMRLTYMVSGSSSPLQTLIVAAEHVDANRQLLPTLHPNKGRAFSVYLFAARAHGHSRRKICRALERLDPAFKTMANKMTNFISELNAAK
jgi:hypothetical protein